MGAEVGGLAFRWFQAYSAAKKVFQMKGLVPSILNPGVVSPRIGGRGGTLSIRISDELWTEIEPLIPVRERRRRYPGRKAIDDRLALNGILHGCAQDRPGRICRASTAKATRRSRGRALSFERWLGGRLAGVVEPWGSCAPNAALWGNRWGNSRPRPLPLLPSETLCGLGFRRCRRRDSNPRHADYDSAALTD